MASGKELSDSVALAAGGMAPKLSDDARAWSWEENGGRRVGVLVGLFRSHKHFPKLLGPVGKGADSITWSEETWQILLGGN